MEGEGCRVCHATDRPRSGDPLLHAGPGRLPHRGRPVHRPAARQARRKAPGGPPWLNSVTLLHQGSKCVCDLITPPWGSDQTYPHYSVGWAWAFDTPYKWTKQIPSFFGGTRNGMAISWPGHITDKGGIRNQFGHVIDIVPTILEATSIPAPVMVDGIAQKPIEGVSLAYTFDKANADAPSHHHTQYFEMGGVQGLYNDGWMLSAVPQRAPWDLAGAAVTDPATAFKFELYDVTHDWTQYTDVAAAHANKGHDTKSLMFGEFAKYQVLPLDASAMTRAITPRPSLAAGRSVFTYSGATVTGIPGGGAPNLLNTSYTITADIDVPQGNA